MKITDRVNISHSRQEAERKYERLFLNSSSIATYHQNVPHANKCPLNGEPCNSTLYSSKTVFVRFRRRISSRLYLFVPSGGFDVDRSSFVSLVRSPSYSVVTIGHVYAILKYSCEYEKENRTLWSRPKEERAHGDSIKCRDVDIINQRRRF